MSGKRQTQVNFAVTDEEYQKMQTIWRDEARLVMPNFKAGTIAYAMFQLGLKTCPVDRTINQTTSKRKTRK